MTKRKTKTKQQKKDGLKIIYLLGFLLAVSTALPSYIESSYLKQFVDLNLIDSFLIGANIITFFSIIFFPRLIKKISNYKTSILILFLSFLSLIFMSVANSPWQVFICLALVFASNSLIWINMDIFVEGFSSEKQIGEIRTIYFTFINLGWVFAPSISGFIAKSWGYRPIFILAAAIFIPFILIFHYKSKNLKDNFNYQKPAVKKTIKTIWQDKNLRGIFFIAFLLQLFYATAVIYVPLQLTQGLGMSWSDIGIIFSIMLIPFLIFEIPAGIIADKYIGEKEILSVGITIIIISLCLFFGIKSNNLILWAVVLFFSRIGASLVEAMRESYFFKIVTVKNVDLINLFRSTQPLAYIFGPILSIVLLKFLPIPYFFLIIAFVFLSAYYFLHLIKDTK